MTPEFSTAAPVRDEATIRRFEQIDRELLELARRHRAREFQFPSLIDKSLLERAEYPQAFPHLLMTSCVCGDPAKTPLFAPENLTPQQWHLSPAVCYHAYGHCQGQVLTAPQTFTARGRCFRKEENLQPGRRQLEFEMREIVLMGTPQWLEETLVAIQRGIDAIAAGHGLSAYWKTAEDPFFLPAAKGKALMQRLKETKKELICDNTAPLAITSINRHETFFGERFAIRLSDGTAAHTACAAFGLDRWAALTT